MRKLCKKKKNNIKNDDNNVDLNFIWSNLDAIFSLDLDVSFPGWLDPVSVYTDSQL